MPNLAHNSHSSIKEGVANSPTVGQNYSCPIKTKLNNWILLAFSFTECNKIYAQTSHEAFLPQEGYLKIVQSEQLIEGIDSLGCKIEFTYQSQKTPNFEVVLEW